MDKPPRTTPPRRWYHRYALVEHRRIGATTGDVVLSWHTFEFAAAGHLFDLTDDRDAAHAGIADMFLAWEIVPVGELC